MRVLILKPRLDLPFKKFAAAISDTNLPEIRTYWEKFVNSLTKAYQEKGDTVFVVEAPRWQFSNGLVKRYQADIVYVPHTEEDRFRGGESCVYYMQSVFPELFTIDKKGWGGGADFVDNINDYLIQDNADDSIFEKYKKRIHTNQSKFTQPDNDIKIDFDKFIFVPLQLPHDETIKYHSDITVPEFVESLCRWSSTSNVPIVFKGHPINPASMKPLIDIIKESSANVTYVENVSIHSIISKCTAVYLINSGVGIESMLHDKPVVSFGKSEYQNFIQKGNIKDLAQAWDDVLDIDYDILKENYRKFFNWYIHNICYDCNTINCFRLP